MEFIKRLFLGYSFFCFFIGLVLGMIICIKYPMRFVQTTDTTGQYKVYVYKDDINKTSEIKVKMDIK